MLNKTLTVQIVKQVSLQMYVEKHVLFKHSEYVNFVVQGSFLASPLLLHQELTHNITYIKSPRI